MELGLVVRIRSWGGPGRPCPAALPTTLSCSAARLQFRGLSWTLKPACLRFLSTHNPAALATLPDKPQVKNILTAVIAAPPVDTADQASQTFTTPQTALPAALRTSSSLSVLSTQPPLPTPSPAHLHSCLRPPRHSCPLTPLASLSSSFPSLLASLPHPPLAPQTLKPLAGPPPPAPPRPHPPAAPAPPCTPAACAPPPPCAPRPS